MGWGQWHGPAPLLWAGDVLPTARGRPDRTMPAGTAASRAPGQGDSAVHPRSHPGKTDDIYGSSSSWNLIPMGLS